VKYQFLDNKFPSFSVLISFLIITTTIIIIINNNNIPSQLHDNLTVVALASPGLLPLPELSS
jgi:hypothetical protein